MLALLAVSFAGWIFIALLSTLVLAIVTQTFRAFEFVVISNAPPPRAEAAIADIVRPRAIWSPYPVIRAQVIESVGGSNIHIHQRPPLFWMLVMLETAMLDAGLQEDIYLALLIFEAMTVVGALFYTRVRLQRGEKA